MTTGKATCFATLKDLAAFEKAKAAGLSDNQAFAVGDNGIGCYGDKTAQLYQPMCAIPPDDMIAIYDSVAAAKHQPIMVFYGKVSALCIIADRMPWKKDIKNDAVIDMNPALCQALGLPEENVDVEVTWSEIEKPLPV
jgi:hypothetical protein